jgi:hypothetical protein
VANYTRCGLRFSRPNVLAKLSTTSQAHLTASPARANESQKPMGISGPYDVENAISDKRTTRLIAKYTH